MKSNKLNRNNSWFENDMLHSVFIFPPGKKVKRIKKKSIKKDHILETCGMRNQNMVKMKASILYAGGRVGGVKLKSLCLQSKRLAHGTICPGPLIQFKKCNYI